MEQKRRRSSGQLVHRSPSEIYVILQDFNRQKGKITTSEFCKSRGVASGSFYAWLKDEKLHGKYSKSSKFVEIRPEEAPMLNDMGTTGKIPSAGPFASLRVGMFELEIHPQVDAAYLRSLLIG